MTAHSFGGERAESDFTRMEDLSVTIASKPFPHLMYHFVLIPWSNWRQRFRERKRWLCLRQRIIPLWRNQPSLTRLCWIF